MNGTDGIGTGYSTQLPCYDPQQVHDYIKSKLTNQAYTKEIMPYYRGFKGTMTKESDYTYMSHGIYKQISKDKLLITELPVGKGALSFKQYKEFILSKMVDNESKKGGFLTDEETFMTDKSFKMTITFKKDTLVSMMQTPDAFEKELKLCNTINTGNIHLYNQNGYIKKYQRPEEIMDEFYGYRLQKYSQRKDHMLEEYDEELTLVSTKAQFIEDIMDETVVMFEKVKNKMVNRTRENVIEQLETLDYPTHQEGYDFLLHMRIDSFTDEMLNKLRKQIDALEEKIKTLQDTSIQELWTEDLKEFEKEYHDYLKNWKSKNPV